jgi:hypothetical protein
MAALLNRARPFFFMRTLLALIIGLSIVCLACDSPPDPRQTNFVIDKGNVKAQYDPSSGHLKKLEVDTNKNGVIDSWTYMDGTRIDRIELDRDEDGKIDRWEHYADGKLVSIGSSTRGDGVEDEWAYPAPAGFLERIETDTDRDGHIDKWQNYDPPLATGGRPFLRSVSFDSDHAGHPTLRLFYRADGSFERSEKLTDSTR